MDNEKTFLGTGWGFPPIFNKGSRNIKMSSGVEDIMESMEIILRTSVGERFHHPGFGSDLNSLLFEPLDTAASKSIKDLISDAIIYHEPRVVLNDVGMEADQKNGSLDISIDFTVVATNTRHNVVYPFYVDEGTNIL